MILQVDNKDKRISELKQELQDIYRTSKEEQVTKEDEVSKKSFLFYKNIFQIPRTMYLYTSKNVFVGLKIK